MKPLTIAEYYTALKDQDMFALEQMLTDSFKQAYAEALNAMRGNFEGAAGDVLDSIAHLSIKDATTERGIEALVQQTADLTMHLFRACMDASVTSQQSKAVNALITATNRYTAYAIWYNVD